MKVPFSKNGEPDIQRLKLGLTLLSGSAILATVALGYLAFLASQEAGEKEAALAARSRAREQRDAELRVALASASSEPTGGVQAIRHFQESLNKLAINHEVKVSNFQSTTSLAPMKSSYSTPDAPGWGMAMVDVTLSGSSKSVFSFIRELAFIPSPFEIEKAFFEPSMASPNGGTQVGVVLNLKVFAKEEKE